MIFKEDLERILGVRPYVDRQSQIDQAEIVKNESVSESSSEEVELNNNGESQSKTDDFDFGMNPDSSETPNSNE